MPIQVLFLCTGNSARSQIAEHILNHLGGGRFSAVSAGTEPRSVHPATIRILAEIGIDASSAESKNLDVFAGQHFDYVITVCDRARDRCPTFPGDTRRIHWSFDDPAAADGDEAEQMKVFRRIRNEITTRIRTWIAAIDKQAGSGK
jgi:arsenate reductase (thioredoxin)